MPKKPVKWGIKAFSLADSSNGYLLNILLYTGAETLDVINQQSSTLPQPARVVLHLLEPYLHQGHHLFTNRYYSNVPLAKALYDNETAFTGTCVRDRVDLPDLIRPPSLVRVFVTGWIYQTSFEVDKHQEKGK